jgi:hypothetical protein
LPIVEHCSFLKDLNRDLREPWSLSPYRTLLATSSDSRRMLPCPSSASTSNEAVTRKRAVSEAACRGPADIHGDISIAPGRRANMSAWEWMWIIGRVYDGREHDAVGLA